MTYQLDRPVCLHGRTVRMDGAIFSNYVLIDNGVIQWVNPTKLPVPPNTLEIELGENDLIFPGFLNLHTHIDYNTIPIWKSPVQRWDNRFEWRANDAYKSDISDVVKAIEAQWDQPAWTGGPNIYTVFAALSELQAIAGGTTVLQETEYLDNEHHILNKHVLIRSTGFPSDIGLPDTEEIDSVIDFYEPQPPPQGKIYPSTWSWKPTATTSLTQGYLPYLGQPKIQGTLVHLAEGRSGFIQSEGVDGYSRNEYEQFMSDLSGYSADDVRATRMTVIHGCGMNVEDETTRQWMIDYGVNLIWSPVSNLLLYNDTTFILPLMADRILVGLGSDWSPSGSKHVWDEAKFARFFLKQVGLPGFDTLLFSMISSTPAYLLGLGQSGRVQNGYYGDLFILRTDTRVENPDAPKALLDSDDSQVRAVIVGGLPLYGDPDFLDQFGLAYQMLPQSEGPVGSTKAVYFPPELGIDISKAVEAIDGILGEFGITRTKFLAVDDQPYQAAITQLEQDVTKWLSSEQTQERIAPWRERLSTPEARKPIVVA